MSKVQKIIQAKAFLETLTHSVDPATGEKIDSTTFSRREILQNVEYIISLLDELIANGGEVVALDKPMDFAVEKINKSKIKVSDSPLQITGFASRINKMADSLGMKRLGPSKISKWLVAKGYLQEERVTVVREEKQILATDTSSNVGIVSKDKIDEKTGELRQTILLTREAQEFIINNLEAIVAFEDTASEDTSQNI